MTLPARTFADLAIDLFLVATQGARQVGAMEGQAMAMARAGGHETAEDRDRLWRHYEAGLLEARSAASATADAHHVMKMLAPYETHIRELIERLRNSEVAA